MRVHGTRACYVFGPEPGGDRSKGCRCEPCTIANRVYIRHRDRASRRPDEQLTPAYIDATEVRAHIRWLARQGVGLRAVAQASGCARSSLAHLKAGSRRRCTPDTAERVLLVFPIDAFDHALVDARSTWRLLDNLIAQGHTKTSIARALGSTAKVPSLQIGRERVTAANARKVKALHSEWMRSVLLDRKQMRYRQRAWREQRDTA